MNTGRVYSCSRCGGRGHNAKTCGVDRSPRVSRRKSSFCTSPRHSYRCDKCGLITSGREDADGRVYPYDKAGDCLTCEQPLHSVCPSEAPCIPEVQP